MVKYFSHGHEAEAKTEAQKSAHVGDVARQGNGQVAFDCLNVGVSDGDGDAGTTCSKPCILR